MINRATADLLYKETLQDLYGAIQTHELPDGSGPSIGAFCKYYKINRSNLFHVFRKEATSDLGVGLYLKIASILGLLGVEYIQFENTPVHNISLRFFLMLDSNAVKDSMIRLRFDAPKA